MDSDDHLPLEETWTLHNLIILIKPIFNENQNRYDFSIFLGTCSYQIGKK